MLHIICIKFCLYYIDYIVGSKTKTDVSDILFATCYRYLFENLRNMLLKGWPKFDISNGSKIPCDRLPKLKSIVEIKCLYKKLLFSHCGKFSTVVTPKKAITKVLFGVTTLLTSILLSKCRHFGTHPRILSSRLVR